MNNQEIAAELNRARVAVETLHGQGFQQQVHINLSPIGPAEAGTILEGIQVHPNASSEQKQEAAYLLSALSKKFPT